jgi:uncharacterized protein
MQIIKAVLDSNVYVSAFGFGGKPKDLIKLGLAGGRFKIVISDIIIKEVMRICVSKIGLHKADIEYVLEEIIYFSELVTPTTMNNATPNKSDNLIISTAVDGNAEFIVTGDNAHLLPLKNYKGIEILTISDFFKKF